MAISSLLELILRSRKEGDAPRIVGSDLKKLRQEVDKTEKSTDKFAAVSKRANLALVALAAGTVAYIGSATMLAARVETLGVVTETLGRTAGLTADEVRDLEEAIQDQGITTEKSRIALSRMIQANIDLSHATDLARLAQDAAVIAGMNSSEAFEHLINVIVTGNVRMGRTIGLQLQFGKALQATATQLGKNVEELTDTEITMARTNEVIRQGAAIAGTYEAAMGTAGKTMLSMPRQLEEIKLAIGNVFLPALDRVVTVLYEAAKAINTYLKVGEDLQEQEHDLAIEVMKSGGAYKDFIPLIEKAAGLQGKQIYTQEELWDRSNNIVEVIEQMASGYRIFNEEQFNALWSLYRLSEGYGDYLPLTKEAHQSQRELTEEFSRAITASERYHASLPKIEEELLGISRAAGFAGSSIDLNLTGSIGRFLDEIEFFLAGGMEIQLAFQKVKTAIEEGKISPEEGQEYLEALFVASEDLQVDLGNLTAKEATENIADQFDIAFGAAEKLIASVDEDLDNLERTIDILIRIRTEGIPGAYQHGGSFKIQGPPGPDKVPVFFMGTAGERVDITPRGQAGPGSGGGLNIYGGINISGASGDPSAMVDEFLVELGRRQQQANASGMGYIGA